MTTATERSARLLEIVAKSIGEFSLGERAEWTVTLVIRARVWQWIVYRDGREQACATTFAEAIDGIIAATGDEDLIESLAAWLYEGERYDDAPE